MILDQTNLPHFEIVFTNAVSAFSVHKELEVKSRVEGGEQFPVFEVPKEIYVNEYVEEVVVMKKNIMNLEKWQRKTKKYQNQHPFQNHLLSHF